MFKKDTVFVLGAGVSVPFGLPSGKMLLRYITSATSAIQTETDADISKVHHGLVHTLKAHLTYPGFADEFIEALRESGTPSIDTWLEGNKKDYIDIGKFCIAAIISHGERVSNRHRYNDDDWYDWLFTSMLKGTSKDIRAFAKNKVNFVTFNYDRMLERKLGNKIFHFFKFEPEEVRREVIGEMLDRIHHVHGHLSFNSYDNLNENYGKIDLGGFGAMSVGAARQRGVELSVLVRELAESVRIIGEKADVELESKVHGFIQGSEKTVFLGFSYDERNLAILGIKQKAKELEWTKSIPNRDRKIIGTAYGLGGGLRDDIEADFSKNILLGGQTMGCVEFCNEYISVK